MQGFLNCVFLVVVNPSAGRLRAGTTTKGTDSIPETSTCWILLAAGVCWMSARGQGTARMRVNSWLPLPAA